MTGIATLSAVVLLLAVASAAVGETCEGIYADALGHPTDCRLYYNLYLMTCPEGQLYNTNTRRCGPAEESTCGQTTSNTIPTEEESTTQSSTTSGSSTTGSSTTDESTTTTGTTTTDVTSTTTSAGTTTTAGSTSTSESTQDTSPTGTSVPTEGSTTPKPSRYECPAVDDPNVKIRYAHDSDCELYYLCGNGVATLYRCSNGNHFSPTKKACRLINEAGCDRCPASEVARLPHETVCAYYYKCEEGTASLYACPEPLEFSRSERVCVEKEDAWCTLEDTVVSSTEAARV